MTRILLKTIKSDVYMVMVMVMDIDMWLDSDMGLGYDLQIGFDMHSVSV